MRPQLEFTKMQSAGNDFILLELAQARPYNSSILAKKMCDRAFGIGSDGLIVYETLGNRSVNIFFYNPDGTPDVCGNGMRCLAGFLVASGLRNPGEAFLINTQTSSVEVQATLEPFTAQILLSQPTYEPTEVPTSSQKILFDSEIELNGETLRISALNTGSTHCVIVVPDLAAAKFEEIGAALEHHPLFPQRTSVELVEVISRKELKSRVWERAIGETPACGTGACAIALVCKQLNLSDSQVTIVYPGGRLNVEIQANGQPLLSGNVEIVFKGSYFHAD